MRVHRDRGPAKNTLTAADAKSLGASSLRCLAAPRHGQQRQSLSKVTACGGLAFSWDSARTTQRGFSGFPALFEHLENWVGPMVGMCALKFGGVPPISIGSECTRGNSFASNSM